MDNVMENPVQPEVKKGFKVFNSDWTCRSFQYELGKEYTHEGTIYPCDKGFHYCKNLMDCFQYYQFDPNNKVAEIEALGEVMIAGDKAVTNHIRIVREITWNEALEMVNLGKGNTGHSNSGNRNSGNRNSGHSNSGHSNSGHSNSGHSNSGDYNSGNRNSGHYNSTNYSPGSFCNKEPEFLLFNKPSPISREDFQYTNANYICRRLQLTDDEGKRIEYKDAWAKLWSSLSNSDKITVQSIPNFDAAVFKDITGIKV